MKEQSHWDPTGLLIALVLCVMVYTRGCGMFG
jgi:hypothetical protein